ncbi:MAG: F0F1 ATP synthase subunit A [Oscillospiraceae bacterium]|nr:F0F1 ATP synthase subunit A [Oscillospiraceae bacterium]
MQISDFFRGSPDGIDVKGPGVLLSFDIGGLTINLTETIVISWGILLAVTLLLLWLTKDLKTNNISKRQVAAEWIVSTVYGLVDDTMGKHWHSFAPYIAALFTFSITGSLVSMLGLRSVTADFNAPLAWALVTFVLIHGTNIRTHGIGGYLKGYIDPVPVMLPINVLSEVSTPVSMSLCHFGNVVSGMVITSLLYFALSAVTKAVGVAFLTIGVPAVLSLYFDLFSGFMQAFVFIMLTMAYISNADGRNEA